MLLINFKLTLYKKNYYLLENCYILCRKNSCTIINPGGYMSISKCYSCLDGVDDTDFPDDSLFQDISRGEGHNVKEQVYTSNTKTYF